MIVSPQRSLYSIALVFLVFSFGCHSLPPYEPLSQGKDFNPGLRYWEEVSLPADLLGDWYDENQLQLSVTEDTLYVRQYNRLIQSIVKSDQYYRIIYMGGTQYNTVYFRNLTEDGLQIAYTDSTAGDEQTAAELPVVQVWYTLTTAMRWTSVEMPEELLGNWHIHDGNMEISIAGDSVVLDGEIWEIEAAQTSHKSRRIILKKSGEYKSLCFKELNAYTLEVLLKDGKENILDRYGNVYGEWQTLFRWWDFIEHHLFYQGSVWTYHCFLTEDNIQVYNTSSPIDSIAQTNRIVGQVEIEITGSTISEGAGSLALQLTFRIDSEEGRYYHALKDSDIQVVTDSSWINTDLLRTWQYEIYLENDTLWFQTERGRVLFSSRKVQPDALVNLRYFVSLLGFSGEIFPEGGDIFTGIKFVPEDQLSPPQTEHLSPSVWTGSIQGETVITWGVVLEKNADFAPGKGFHHIRYQYRDCDRRYWFVSQQYLNPYVKEEYLYCWLLSFEPGS